MKFLAILANSWKTIFIIIVILQILLPIIKILKIVKFSWTIVFLPLEIGIPLVIISILLYIIIAKTNG